MTSAKKIIRFPQPRLRRGDDETAFLPAALEVVETPPSPVGRAIAVTIMGFFCLALVWVTVGTVDMVAIAPGKIMPSGRTKVIQPFETGVVHAIHIRDGQSVRAGDVLIELDSTMNVAEVEHVKSDLVAARLDIARYRAALGEGDPLAAFDPPAEASPELVEMSRQYLAGQIAEINAKIAEIDGQRAQKEAERDTIAATVAKLDATIPVLQERSEIRKYLYGRELGSKVTYLTDMQELISQQQERLVQLRRQAETQAAVATLTESRNKALAEYRRTQFEELTKAQQKAAGLTQDVVKTRQRARLQQLTSPIDGVIQQLAVYTIGGVVTPAQTIAVVVPIDSGLEIEAMVSNRDIGFVHASQEAAIKIDTFNFTRYGLLAGKVLSVSQDAIMRDKPQDKAGAASAANSDSSEPKGQELSYSARVSLDKTQMQIDEKLLNLSPGMAVTVEIKTGTRSILSYLLSPIAKYKHDVLRER
jgi:hemolysin D